MEYIIVARRELVDLEKAVNEFIQQGWRPVGGVSSCGVMVVMQAMTREKPAA